MKRRRIAFAALAGLSLFSLRSPLSSRVHAQAGAATSHAFEAASVRANKSPNVKERLMSVTPGRINYIGVTLMDAISAAYGLKYSQISGPDWMQSGQYRYDIVAKAEENADKDELMRMLQSLLTDRFKLAAHHDVKEMAVYALLPGKNIAKLRRSQASTKEGMEPVPGGLNFHASMLTLTGFLSGRLGRQVIDKTGLDGTFDFTLRISDSDGEKGLVETKRALAQSDPSLWIDAIDATGLKLESQKAPVEFLIIDNVEKVPTEN